MTEVIAAYEAVIARGLDKIRLRADTHPTFLGGRRPMSLMSILTSVFTWWNGSTIGTNVALKRAGGELVGEDEFGNKYYRLPNDPAKNAAFGTERRWVIYAGYAEASAIPAGWHGWMHHTVNVPPANENYAARDWQKPHLENRTGTADAYRPKGSALSTGKRPAATGDYQAWSPGD